MVMSDELQHHGILGQRWGVRRYQNSDGSLTNAGKARKRGNDSSDSGKKKGKGKEESSGSKKTTSKDTKKMSDDELSQAVRRLQLEKQYKDLTKSDSKKGQGFVQKLAKQSGQKIVQGSVENIGQQWMTYVLGSGVNKLYGHDVVNPRKGQKN